MSRLTKLANLKEGEEALEILVAFDYRVIQFSPVHFRINERLDVWPSTKRWYDQKTFRKGAYDDLVKMVKNLLPQQNMA